MVGRNKKDENGARGRTGAWSGASAGLLVLLVVSGGWTGWRFWSSPQESGWAEWMLLFLLVLIPVVALCRGLPCQNVVLASGLIAGMALGLEAVAVWSGAAGISYREEMGVRGLFGLVPWVMGLVWVSFIGMSRGVAQAVVWRREGRNYGLRVLGATVLLVVLLFVGASPAGELKGYWEVRSGGRTALFLVKGLSAVVVLVAVTPVLMRKKPGVGPVAYEAVVAWVGVNLVWVAGAVAVGSWWTALLIVAQVILVAGLVINRQR